MILIQVIGTFAAVISVAITLGVPKKFLGYAGLVGAVGWLVYLLLAAAGASTVAGMFLAALVVAMISHIFARLKKTPVTLFLIAGILPLVPGVGMYRIVYNLITNNNSLAGYYFSETMQLAGMIALAIFIMDTIFRIFQRN
ncbi:threonine/serine exporter family protein [Anaerocolumna sp. AGMB13025]|uniref:threonine/serine exporter family protein n=1 Tax=Anaerocolumna sp. AGMB13025 TaxID=3039116 RepID=UPI00241CF102|nr:threonine/serine exporter family protein [Anaerocolumna sp. AGMB13025]WFR59697.1 threonine/serine exporter family protein [Anaerocolumna sp. AGMB13025]